MIRNCQSALREFRPRCVKHLLGREIRSSLWITRATRSHIVAPQILPFGFRTKFRTLIGDVASTGNSGSGVFDPNRKCLLGIMSRKFMVGGKYVAKYFVPASEIREFIPIERRDQVLMN